MTTTNTIASRQTVATQMRSLVQKSKPDIQILLNNREGSSISTFSTGDKIEGEVLMTAPHDCRFDDISVTFEGSVKTYVEKLAATSAANSRSKAFHNFLKLKQPIDESSLPVPRVAEAGKTYRFPFTFVVPGHLLPHACNHRVESNQVHDEHLLLPPSLNDNTSTASDGTSVLDDLAPMMSIISYSIKAEVTRYSPSTDHAITLSVKSQKVHIIPSVPEAPPLSIDGQSEEYVLRREKGLRRGLFKGKLGRLSISALQPKSLRLPAPLAPSAAATTASSPPTTMATIALRFDPADAQAKPPKLGQLNAKLHAQTYFASRPMRDFPTPSSAMYDAHRGLYDDTIALSSRCVEGAQWTAHSTSDSVTESSSLAAAAAERRDSAFSTLTSSSSGSSVTALPTSPADAPSAKNRTTSIYYTADLLVPLTLPRNKSFVPSFHSCLVARLYQLDLSLSVPSLSSTSPATTLKLRLPLQLSAQGPLDLANPTGSSAADEEPALQRLVDEDLEAVFRPRQISVPRADLLENGRLGPRAHPSAPANGAPPGYSSFAGAPEDAPLSEPEREAELDMRRPAVGVWG
ncbi:MAG: hypothetical protein M1824_004390 [Vezdaea acicularis]|nr:MAG: hypothetical protein M1824_004390 [Vezdaea acicularis]